MNHIRSGFFFYYFEKNVRVPLITWRNTTVFAVSIFIADHIHFHSVARFAQSLDELSRIAPNSSSHRRILCRNHQHLHPLSSLGQIVLQIISNINIPSLSPHLHYEGVVTFLVSAFLKLPIDKPLESLIRSCLKASICFFFSSVKLLFEFRIASIASNCSIVIGIIKSLSFPGADLYKYGFSSIATACSNLNCLFLWI